MTHPNFTLLPHTATYYDHGADDYVPLDYTAICEQSQAENMQPLTPLAISEHPFGMATVAEWWSAHGVQHTDVAAYTGITGFEQYNGKKYAILGAMVALPWARGKGIGFTTANAVHELASSDAATTAHGHVGLLARCNPHSQKLTEKLGFTQVSSVLGKAIMVKLF